MYSPLSLALTLFFKYMIFWRSYVLIWTATLCLVWVKTDYWGCWPHMKTGEEKPHTTLYLLRFFLTGFDRKAPCSYYYFFLWSRTRTLIAPITSLINTSVSNCANTSLTFNFFCLFWEHFFVVLNNINLVSSSRNSFSCSLIASNLP